MKMILTFIGIIFLFFFGDPIIHWIEIKYDLQGLGIFILFCSPFIVIIGCEIAKGRYR